MEEVSAALDFPAPALPFPPVPPAFPLPAIIPLQVPATAQVYTTPLSSTRGLSGSISAPSAAGIAYAEDAGAPAAAAAAPSAEEGTSWARRKVSRRWDDTMASVANRTTFGSTCGRSHNGPHQTRTPLVRKESRNTCPTAHPRTPSALPTPHPRTRLGRVAGGVEQRERSEGDLGGELPAGQRERPEREQRHEDQVGGCEGVVERAQAGAPTEGCELSLAVDAHARGDARLPAAHSEGSKRVRVSFVCCAVHTHSPVAASLGWFWGFLVDPAPGQLQDAGAGEELGQQRQALVSVCLSASFRQADSRFTNRPWIGTRRAVASSPGRAAGPISSRSWTVQPRRVSGPAQALWAKTVQSRRTAALPDTRLVTSPAAPPTERGRCTCG